VSLESSLALFYWPDVYFLDNCKTDTDICSMHLESIG